MHECHVLLGICSIRIYFCFVYAGIKFHNVMVNGGFTGSKTHHPFPRTNGRGKYQYAFNVSN